MGHAALPLKGGNSIGNSNMSKKTNSNTETTETRETPRSVIRPVGKITAKALCPEVKKLGRSLNEENPGPVFIGRIVGLTRGYEAVPSDQYGDSLRFKGEFRAYDAKGNVLISASAFVPGVLADQLQLAIDGRADKTSAVEFAADLHLAYSESSATGYQYVVEVHTEARSSEPLTALESSLPKLPSLS